MWGLLVVRREDGVSRVGGSSKEESGRVWTLCRGSRRSPAGAGHGAGGGAGDLQELDTVREVAMQEPRAGGGARLWQQRDTVQGVAQESQCRWTWCRGWRRRPAGAGHGVGGGD